MNIRTKDILNCLPLLASVLGDRYGVKVMIGGSAACTNGNVIHLPALPLENDAETLELVSGYIDHESAHIRHTDFEAMREASMNMVEKSVFNAIEDWRVEERLASIFPGCRANLNRLIRKFFAGDDTRAGDDPALAVLNYVLLTVRSWAVPEVIPQCIIQKDVVRKHYFGLPEKLDAILDRVKENCPDTKAAIDYACEIVAIVANWQNCVGNSHSYGEQQKRQVENAVPDNANENMVEGDQTGKTTSIEDYAPDTSGRKTEDLENGETSSTDFASHTEMPSESDLSEDVGPGEAKKQSAPVGEEENGNAPSVDEGAYDEEEKDISPEEEYIIQHFEGQDKGTPQLLEILEQILASDPDKLRLGIGEIIASELNSKNQAQHQSGLEVAITGETCKRLICPQEKQEALRSSIALRTRLSGLLQAQALRQSCPARYGKICSRNLYRMNIGNPKIFQREEIKPAINTAVHILLDRSSSMLGSRIAIARQSCMAVAKSLASISGINLGVSAFPEYPKHQAGIAVAPLVRHGEKVRDNFGIEAYGGTPLSAALLWVMQQILPLSEPRKMLILLTDGYPDNLEVCNQAIGKMRKLGMEIYALGIQTEAVSRLQANNSQVIRELAELPAALFGLLKDALVKGGSHASAR